MNVSKIRPLAGRSKKMKRAVFEFFTKHTSGVFPAWDIRAIAVKQYLRRKGIDHVCFYRNFSENSKYPLTDRHKISNDQLYLKVFEDEDVASI